MKTTELCEQLCKPLIESMGFELCDVEFVKEYGDWVLIYSAKGTSYVDNPGAGTWQYRVRAVVDGTKTPYSNRKRITIG